jgi:hypothetical protein
MCALQLGNSLVWDPPYCWGSERRKGLGIRPFQHLPLLWNHHIPEYVYIYLLKESSKNHLPIRHMWHLTIDSTLSFLPILYNCQYDNNCQKQCLGFDHWVHLLWTSPAIKALVRNPGAFTTLFALTRVRIFLCGALYRVKAYTFSLKWMCKFSGYRTRPVLYVTFSWRISQILRLLRFSSFFSADSGKLSPKHKKSQ